MHGSSSVRRVSPLPKIPRQGSRYVHAHVRHASLASAENMLQTNLARQALHTSALLFGALVQHSLVSHITLGMFLRYVLEALRNPPGSKMCKFGVAALESFRDRLPEWPQYCQHLHAIPHFAQVLPDLVPLLEDVCSTAAEPEEAAAGAVVDH